MGQEISRSQFAEADFARFHAALGVETDLLERVSAGAGFRDPRHMAGLELEAWLLDHASCPNPCNQDLLARLADPLVVPELSRFNVEFNAWPLQLGPGALQALARELDATWRRAQHVAHGMDAVLAMIGILPSIRDRDLTPGNMSAMNRFTALNGQVMMQRGGEPVRICIAGVDELRLERRDVMLEAATTSLQLHLQVPEPESGRYYNASLIAAAPILALAVNSPLLFGRQLWAETRIPLFEQAIELGGYGGLAEADVRRVGFGRGYVGRSLIELFRENLELFPVLLPVETSAATEQFPHVRLHNGCIWRWVRPLVGFDSQGQIHVRIEQRVLPSGPTIADMMANAAFYFGLARALATRPLPPEQELSFAEARSNFYAAARDGLGASLRWFGGAVCAARDLLRDELLPLAARGLEGFGLASAEAESHLGILRARVDSGQTGAAWLVRHFAAVKGDLLRLTADYVENQRTGVPVHEWN